MICRIVAIACLLTCILSGCSEHKVVDPDLERYRNDNTDKIPDSVFEFKNLKSISFSPGWVMSAPISSLIQTSSEHHLTEVEKRFCELKKLEKIDFAYQDLKTLPSCVYELENLKVLDLSYNVDFKITPLIRHLPKMKKLEKLSLYMVTSAMQRETEIRSLIDTNKTKLIITEDEYFKPTEH